MKTQYTITWAVALGAALATVFPLHASDEDARIESAAKKSYIFRVYLHDDSVKARARDGVVTLTGTVADEFHKSLAEDTVLGLPGVKTVNDQLEVKAPHADMYSDAWLEAKVKTALLFHRNVSATATKVEVRDGIVSLTGEANSEAQKELTTEYAKDIIGVKDVRNLMAVAVATEKPVRSLGQVIDDASITAEIKLSLATHRSTSALNTKVETRNAVVTVSGMAKNAAERDLVTKLAEDIDGVTSVVNNMNINASGATE